MPDQQPPRRARLSSHSMVGIALDPTERDQWATKFGVASDQIDHDYLISHILAALSDHKETFIFYGGTALSRTILSDLRLSEDIDLLSIGSRHDVAPVLDQAIRDYIEPRFGTVTADPWLAQARVNTQACVFHIGGIDVQIQLIDGTDYTPWPTQDSTVEPRYSRITPIHLTTYTPAAFVGAKTSAWTETTRNAPRDLYDLWALAQHGYITSDAARLFRRYGPTSGYPESWLLPATPPTDQQWQDALRHQCIPQVTASQAYDTVTRAWASAVTQAKNNT